MEMADSATALAGIEQHRTKTQTQTGAKISCSQKIPPSQLLEARLRQDRGQDDNRRCRPFRVFPACHRSGSVRCDGGLVFGDPKQPTTIELCPATCSTGSTGKSRLTFEISCLPPPPFRRRIARRRLRRSCPGFGGAAGSGSGHSCATTGRVLRATQPLQIFDRSGAATSTRQQCNAKSPASDRMAARSARRRRDGFHRESFRGRLALGNVKALY
jgi:hypothetical protein